MMDGGGAVLPHPLYLPKGPFRHEDDDDESCLSPESSIHPSDYDSDDSSCTTHEECSAVEENSREASTISISSSLASWSFSNAAAASAAAAAASSVTATNQPKFRPSSSHIAILAVEMAGPESSSSSSSGDDGWKTESSSGSCVSSLGDNGSEYDDARRNLQSRQRTIRRSASNKRGGTATAVAGCNFARPIDVEQLQWPSTTRGGGAASIAPPHLQRLDLDDVDDLSQENSPSVSHRIIGLAQQSAGRKAMVQGDHQSRRAKRAIYGISIPHELPLSRHEEDDMSTIGGRSLSSYRDLVRFVMQHRRPRTTSDIEKGHVLQGTTEMCLILIIAASLVALVVLLALILKTRE